MSGLGTSRQDHGGPLAGLNVVEMAAIGPVPLCGALLADLGANVLRIDRPGGAERVAPANVGGRPVLALDLKSVDGIASLRDLIGRADILIEGFRPGVMERLGVGPDVCLAANPCLVYGRCTGWGQDGPLAQAAGHDINYLAITGVLHATGTPDQPVPPLNLVGDFGGGTMLLAVGILAAVIDARATGIGQVVDAAMIDGVGLLSSAIYEQFSRGRWHDRRGANSVDGGSPWYRCYCCSDGKWIAVGALEPQFRASLAQLIGLPALVKPGAEDRAAWPALTDRAAALFAAAPRDAWIARSEGMDCCLTPVLDLTEAPNHPHNRARQGFIAGDRGWRPAPAPRLSKARRQCGPQDLETTLEGFGMTPAATARLG